MLLTPPLKGDNGLGFESGPRGVSKKGYEGCRIRLEELTPGQGGQRIGIRVH